MDGLWRIGIPRAGVLFPLVFSLSTGCGGRVDLESDETITHSSDSGAGGTTAASSAGAGGAFEFSCSPDYVRSSDLPDCSYVDACHAPGEWYDACWPSDDCAFTFEAEHEVWEIDVGCMSTLRNLEQSSGYWRYGGDRRTIQLVGTACEAWRALGGQVIMRSIVHSCIL